MHFFVDVTNQPTLFSNLTSSSLPNFDRANSSQKSLAIPEMPSQETSPRSTQPDQPNSFLKRTQSQEDYYQSVRPDKPARTHRKVLPPPVLVGNSGKIQNLLDPSDLTYLTENSEPFDDGKTGTSPFGWSDMTSECL